MYYLDGCIFFKKKEARTHLKVNVKTVTKKTPKNLSSISILVIKKEALLNRIDLKY
jgi:hypothetical protein